MKWIAYSSANASKNPRYEEVLSWHLPENIRFSTAKTTFTAR
ncbi:hypothetical protein ACLBOM_10120 [Escherichia coli]